MNNEGFKKEINIEALILAGGKGTRMKSEGPKPMEIVDERPMIAYGLDVLEKLNFNEKNIVCLIGYKGEVIKSYLGKKVKFAEHKDFAGNMGAVLDAMSSIDSNATEVLIIQGDDCVFLDEKELRKMLEEYEVLQPDISIMLTKNTDRNRTRFTLNDSKKVVEIRKQEKDDDTAGLFVNGVFIFSVPIIKEYLEKIKDKKENNYAFIDSQNLNLGIQKLGWKLDYRKFRVYLTEKYGVKKAYIFIGFVALNQSLYDRLQEAGFILEFKPTIPDADGKIKGNIDADLVLRATLELNDYDKAVIVSSDGDFYSLAQHLYEKNKLKVVLSPDEENCSNLLKQTAKEKIWFMNNLRDKLEYKKKNTA